MWSTIDLDIMSSECYRQLGGLQGDFNMTIELEAEMLFRRVRVILDNVEKIMLKVRNGRLVPMNVELKLANMDDFAVVNKWYSELLFPNCNPPARSCFSVPLEPVFAAKEGTVQTIRMRIRIVGAVCEVDEPDDEDDGSMTMISESANPQESARSEQMHMGDLRLAQKQRENAFRIAMDAKVARLRSTTHVQGISYWAMACIGPYAQATKWGSEDNVLYSSRRQSQTPACQDFYSAGVLGLIPHVMQFPQTGDLTLKHQI